MKNLFSYVGLIAMIFAQFEASASEGNPIPARSPQSIIDEATAPREITSPYAPATEQTPDCGGPYSPPPRAECGPQPCGPSWSSGYSVVYDAVPKTETVTVKKLKVCFREETRTRTVQKMVTVQETRNVTIQRPVTEIQTVTKLKTVERCVPYKRIVCCQDPCDPCNTIQKECIEYRKECVTVPYTCEVPVTRYVPEVVQQTVPVQRCITVEEPYTVRVPYTICVEEQQQVTTNDYRARVVPNPCPPAPTCAPGPVYLPDSCPPPAYRPLPPPPCGVYGPACPPPAPSVLQPWAPAPCPPPCRTCPILDFFEAIGDGLAELFTPCPPQPCYCPPKPCCGAGPRSPY